MNNKEFWECITAYKHENAVGEELLCDQLVKNGLGQTIGGYFIEAKRPEWMIAIDSTRAGPSHNIHFYQYYVQNRFDPNKGAKRPSYSNLNCPQLIMYISEVAGLNRDLVKAAYSYLEKYERENNLVGKSKGADYLPAYVLQTFKKLLCIDQITSAIKKANPGRYEEDILQYIGRIEKPL